MARSSHTRSGTYVEGHWRNNTWIEGHERCGTNVSESSSLTQSQRNKITKLLNKYFSPLVFETNCYWCQKPVFFHRAKNGGSALFDRLGSPWHVHSCWERFRDMTQYGVIADLYHSRFNGEVYYKQRTRRPKPRDATCFQASGFIDNLNTSYYSVTRFPSFRDAKTSDFLLRHFIPEDSIDVYYEILIPRSIGYDFSRYSMHRITCEFLKKGRTWLCFARDYQRLSAGHREEKAMVQLVDLSSKCFICGTQLIEGDLGFGTNYSRECSDCGEIRKQRTTEDLDDFIAKCSRYRRRRGRRWDS